MVPNARARDQRPMRRSLTGTRERQDVFEIESARISNKKRYVLKKSGTEAEGEAQLVELEAVFEQSLVLTVRNTSSSTAACGIAVGFEGESVEPQGYAIVDDVRPRESREVTFSTPSEWKLKEDEPPRGPGQRVVLVVIVHDERGESELDEWLKLLFKSPERHKHLSDPRGREESDRSIAFSVHVEPVALYAKVED